MMNSALYQILINPITRQEYCKLSNIDQNKFVIVLEKIFKGELAINELKSLGINCSKSDWEYLEKNFYDLFNALNLHDVFNFFKFGTFPKKKLDNIGINTESDNEIHNLYETYFDLPIYYQKNSKNDINRLLNTKSTLEQKTK